MTGIVLCEISSGLAIEANAQHPYLDQEVDILVLTTGAVGDVEWATKIPNTGGMPYLGTFDVLPPHLTLTDNGDGTARITGTRDIWLPSYAPDRPLIATDAAGQSAEYLIKWATPLDPPILMQGRTYFHLANNEPINETYQLSRPVGSRVFAWNMPVHPSGLTLTDNGDNTATLTGSLSGGSAGETYGAVLSAQYSQGGPYPPIEATIAGSDSTGLTLNFVVDP